MIPMPPDLPASLLLIAAALIGAGVGLERWRVRNRRPQARTGAYVLWSASFWLLTIALQLVSPDLETKLVWNRAQFFGMLPIPVLWLYLATQFTGFDRFLTRRRLLLLGIVPGIELLLIVTDPFPGLIFARTRLDTTGALQTEFGPVLWLGAFYSYGLLLIATLLMVWMMTRRSGFRWQGSMLLSAAILAIGANILDLAHLSPWGEVSLTPLALIVTVPVFIASLVRLQRIDIVPVARGNVIQGMRDPVIVLDHESRIIDLNPAAQQLIRHELPGVRGKPLTAVWPAWLDYSETLLQDTSSSAVIRLNQDNQACTFDVSTSPLQDWRGQIISYILILRDISERVGAEETLRRSEEQFRALTENATDIVIIVDGDGLLRYSSPSIERTFGFNESAIIGKSAFDFIHPDDTYPVLTALTASAQNPGIAAPIIARFRQADGDWRKLECVANNLLDHPAVRGIVVNARDVTERVQAEERLKASLGEKEVLLKEIHHRVKNNLQIISSLLHLQATATDDPTIQMQYQDSQNRIRSMALIHERLYRSGNLASIDFSPYLHDLADSLVQTYRSQSQRLKLKIETDPVLLDIDTAVTCGLLVNELVSNAFKHAFPDGRDGEIAVEMRYGVDGQYRLTVCDNGIGLPADVDLLQSKTLGLQLVANLTKQLGGTISLSTDEGTSVVASFSANSTEAGTKAVAFEVESDDSHV